MVKYRKLTNSTRENRSSEGTDWAGDLDTIAREGARRMLVSALDAEVTEFLGRQRYERAEAGPGYRNGYGKGSSCQELCKLVFQAASLSV